MFHSKFLKLQTEAYTSTLRLLTDGLTPSLTHRNLEILLKDYNFDIHKLVFL